MQDLAVRVRARAHARRAESHVSSAWYALAGIINEVRREPRPTTDVLRIARETEMLASDLERLIERHARLIELINGQ